MMFRGVASAVLMLSGGFSMVADAVMNQQELHERVLYPITRIRTTKAGGSGVLVYSKEDSAHPGQFLNLVLTCEHVVDDAISVKEEWDSLLKKNVKQDIVQEVSVEVFDYIGSNVSSANATRGTVIAYDKQHDLAAIRLLNTHQLPWVATLIPRDKVPDLKLFDGVWTSGCSLLHDPFSNPGTLTYLREMIEQKSYLMYNAPSIFGNCLTGDSLVSMADGTVKPISEVGSGDTVWSIQPGTGLNQHTVEERVTAGPKEIYELKTRTRHLRASGNHPLLAVKSAKDWRGHLVNWLEWTPMEELSEGSIIAVLPGLPERGRGSGIRFTDFIGQDKDPTDLLTLLGFYMGDGWLRAREEHGSYELSLAVYDGAAEKKYTALLEDLFGVRVSNSNGVLHVYSKEVVEKFIQLGVVGKSVERTIPDWIMTQPHDYQMAFLEGYVESDGHVNKSGAWVFEANNSALISRLRMLCIHMGMNVSNIFSRLRQPVYIDNREATPSGPSYSFQVYPEYSKSRDTQITGSKTLLPDYLSYERIRLINKVGVEETYDLKVEGAHNFIANGVNVHNSGGGLFHGTEGYLLGLCSRITTMQLGFGMDVLTFMGFSTTPERMYEFIDHQELQFLVDDSDDYNAALKRREKKQREARRGMLLESEDGEQK